MFAFIIVTTNNIAYISFLIFVYIYFDPAWDKNKREYVKLHFDKALIV